jgi:hypothetical protein
MRFREFAKNLISEGLDDLDPVNHEDKADAHGYNDIANVLTAMKAQMENTGLIPRKSAEEVVSAVNAQRGDNSFRWTDLNDAIKSGVLNNIVDKVEPDPKTSVNYVYFTEPDSQIQGSADAGSGAGGGGAGGSKNPEAVVSKMAKRAAS